MKGKKKQKHVGLGLNPILRGAPRQIPTATQAEVQREIDLNEMLEPDELAEFFAEIGHVYHDARKLQGYTFYGAAGKNLLKIESTASELQTRLRRLLQLLTAGKPITE